MKSNNSLVLISACFLAGAVAGSAAAMYAADGTEITGFFTAMSDVARAGELSNSFLSVLIPNLLWPLLIFFFGFSALGVIGIPLCVFAKGFLISYSVSAIIRAFGFGGIWFALASMGIHNLPYVFLILLVAVLAVRLSAGTAPNEPAVLQFMRFGITVAVFTGISAYQAFVQPKIITWLMK